MAASTANPPTLVEQIATVMREADEARDQVEYHTAEASKQLRRVQVLVEVIASLQRAKSPS